MRRRLIVACATASLVIGLGWQVSAFARPLEGPRAAFITTSSGISAPGGSLTVNGQNFAPGETILLTLFSHGVPIGGTSSNGIGSFSTSVTIPSGTTPGEHTIVATGATGDSANTGIDVVINQVINQATAAPSIAALGSGPSAGPPEDASAESHHARARARDGHDRPWLCSWGPSGRFDQRERGGAHYGEQPRGVLRLTHSARPGGGAGEGHRHVWTQEFRGFRQPGNHGEGFSA